jgi:hypothetical protein
MEVISTFSPDRLYRVTIERGEVYFIRIGGQSGVAVGVASQFGVFGALFPHMLKKRTDRKLAGKEMSFQFETVDDMRAAYDLLPALGGVHLSDVVYDAARNRFAKGVTVMTSARS